MSKSVRTVALALAFALYAAVGSQGYADDLSAGHKVPLKDAAIASAIQRAQSDLPKFLALLDSPPPGTSSFAVKLGIVDTPDGYRLTTDLSVNEAEFFWLVDVQRTGAGFVGTINDPPETVQHVHDGQVLSFNAADIVDWLYVDDGKLVGDFTACPVLLAGPSDELKSFEQQTGIKCE